MDKIDLRVIKTKRNIELSFIKLLRKQDFDQITVNNIIDTALINRSTFYKYFDSKYDLLEQLALKEKNDFEDYLTLRFSAKSQQEILDNIDALYHTLYSRHEVISALWKVQTEHVHLYQDMAACLKHKFEAYYTSLIKSETNLDYLSTMFASLVLSSIKWCLENNGYDDIKPCAIKFQKLIYQFLQIIVDKP